jgi:hypothetical protein
MSLTEFLLAQIDEDEAVARRAWTRGAGMPNLPQGWVDEPTEELVAYNARFDPVRVVAECEAKRRIVSRCDMIVRGREAGMFNDGQLTDARDNMRALALPYADHPDYRDEWRP